MINNGEDHVDFLTTAEKNLERIRQFAKQQGYEITTYSLGERDICFIGPEQDVGLTPFDVQTILGEKERIEREDGQPNGNCYQIAARAVMEDAATGRLESDSTAKEFTSQANHALNYLTLSSGRVTSIDYTAGDYINRRNGNFSVLAIFGTSTTDVIRKLNALYGGDWRVSNPRDVTNSYKIGYGTEQQKKDAYEEIRRNNPQAI